MKEFPLAPMAAPRRSLLLLASILAVLNCGHRGPDEATTDGLRLDVVPAFGGRHMAIDGIARLGGGYLIADAGGDQLVRVDFEDGVVESWSQLSPTSIPVDEPLYVGEVDEDVALVYLGAKKVAMRVDQTGQVLLTYALEDFFGFDVTSADRLWVGRPWSGGLVATYDAEGNALLGLGALKSLEDVYPQAGDATFIDPALRDPFLFLNLVHIEADDRGGAFLTFRFAPIVQRYDRDGKLLWETRLEGREVEGLEKLYLSHETREGGQAVRMELQGMVASLVTLGAAFDTATDKLYVLLANQTIAPLDGSGNQGRTLLPRIAQADSEPYPFLLTVHSLKPGVILFTNPILARSWSAATPVDFVKWPSGE